METATTRSQAKHQAIHRPERPISHPDSKVSRYFGENTFNIFKESSISESIRKEATHSVKEGKRLNEKTVEEIAKIVTEWAVAKGATHFCHWFQPLTGNTAEKHDAFLSFDGDEPIEKLSKFQLMQGEPDASSFPHGGTRSTFEARGYTSWDLTSPFFIMENVNGKTLCIPTAFVSYHGDALDIKTPLLRSISRIDKVATKFLQLCGDKNVNSVKVTSGAEQEYFLVDKSFYYLRQDLTMTGRTLLGSLPAKNQQLSDHYFGTIPQRVESFMQEMEVELYKLGIPAKTRHNEVAPGQFEIAPIFRDGNLSSDHGQIIMAVIKETALKHGFVALLHEKPFAGVNGSGKHLNWSMSCSNGTNLLEPGDAPHDNARFLAVVSVILEAVYRHADTIRMAISGHGNDHRLGANEAPPSIISVFLGETLDKIFKHLAHGGDFSPSNPGTLDLGVNALMNLARDNTDRNRTSPFAFTGNKFEFRAVGSSQNVGFPMTILNGAVAEVFDESNSYLENELNSGKSIEDALISLAKKYAKNAEKIIFNGDGYSEQWVEEAASRGLPNLRTTSDALAVLRDEKATNFLFKQKIFNPRELETVHNVLIDRYNMCREIEFETLGRMVHQFVLPASFAYKSKLSEVIKRQKEIGLESSTEVELYKNLNFITESLYAATNNLMVNLEDLKNYNEVEQAEKMAKELLPISEDVAEFSNKLEELLPDAYWTLPTYFDMLFVR